MGKAPLSPLDMLAQVCSILLAVGYPEVEQESDSKGKPTTMKENLQDLPNGPPPNLINDPIFSPGHPKKKRSELCKKHRLQIKENEMMKKKTGKQKKKKNKKVSKSKASTFAAQASGPNPPLDIPIPLHIPTALRNLIQRKGGYDVKLIIEKELYDADVNKGQNRFSMPLRQILSENFLNDNEKLLLSATDEQGRNRNDGIVVDFIEPCFDETTMLLKKRDFRSTSSYVLIKNWRSVAVKNKLLKGDTVQAWFFRVKARPWIALVKPLYAQAHYS